MNMEILTNLKSILH